MLAFEVAGDVGGEPACLKLVNCLKVPVVATGLGDTCSLIILMAPTIFWDAGAQVRQQMGIADGRIRFLVGQEDAADLLADLLADFEQALR